MAERNNRSIFDKPNVFLSYSHDDKEVVEQVAENLKAAGHNCWIDSENLRSGDKYNPKIDEAIDNCEVFIAFLSKTYVNKVFCAFEFDRAKRGKSIIAVCLDDVTEFTNRQAAYMFGYLIRDTIAGFGTGAGAEELSEDIIKSTAMQALLGGEKVPVTTPDYILAILKEYHKKQYEQSGNYALNEIRGELFTSINDLELDVNYKDENNRSASLITYLEGGSAMSQKTGILLTGDGGMGKTVSLLKTCEYLLNGGRSAIYIPLSKIDEGNTLEKYLLDKVCKGNISHYNDLCLLMKVETAGEPLVYLLLDGINEVTAKDDYLNYFVKKVIGENYLNYSSVKLIMTSRWFDSQTMNCLKDRVIRLEMQPLDKNCIMQYLSGKELSVPSEKTLSVIKTPLLLTLYSDVEKHKEKYAEIKGIELFDNPDTPGKILSNFFQTQLFRASEEATFDLAAHLVLLEFFLPLVAYKTVFASDGFDIWDCIDEIENKTLRYTWCHNDKLRRLLGRSCDINADDLLSLATSSLHFLHSTDGEYSFLHQSFRDYFAAYYIANEMWAFNKDIKRFDEVSPVLLEETLYNDDILGFVSDIVREEEAAPSFDENGWHFPEKSGIASPCERLLDLWRNKEGEAAQNAVCNLVTVMKIGRSKSLANCDFSNLDLRKCWLNGCHFVEWYEDRQYPSNFDGAWLNRECFINNGHETTVTAACTNGGDIVFSGDKNGAVKIFDLEKNTWIKTMQPQSTPVIDMAWDSVFGRLAIVYQNEILLYSYANETFEAIGNSIRSKNFRYVKFAENGDLLFTYDMEPLTWRNSANNNEKIGSLPSQFSFDVPAKCAKWHPQKPQFVRSNLLQLLSIAGVGESGSWEIHPALKKYMLPEAESDKAPKIDFEKVNRIISQFDYIKKSGRKEYVPCFTTIHFDAYKKGTYHKKSYKVAHIIAIDNYLIIYDLKNKTVLAYHRFTEDIDRIVYTGSSTVNVDIGNVTIVFDLTRNLSLHTAFLRLRSEGADGSVSSIDFHRDGRRLLVSVKELLLEYDTDSLELLRKKSFKANIQNAHYENGRIIAATGRGVMLLDENFAEIAEIKGSQIQTINTVVENHDKNGYYLISSNGEIKKLNLSLVVQNIRKTRYNSAFMWVKDRRSGRLQMAFRPANKHPNGSRYTYETDFVEPLGWCYTFFDEANLIDENYLYKLDTRLLTTEKEPPFREIFYNNYTGIWIFGCSFKDIKGNLSESKNQNFIYRNGGITDGTAK